MVLIASSAAAQATRKSDGAGGFHFHRSTFIGSDAGAPGIVAALPAVPADSLTPYPVSYLIELDPFSGLDVHFHRANQFQVFLEGSGTLARHSVQAITVHYAGAFTAYGPIRPGARGLTFLTLRDAWDPGARFLPEHKDELRLARVGRREVHAPPLTVADAQALRELRQAQLCTVMQPADDGLAAWSLCVPPGAPVDAPHGSDCGGRFWVVLAGALQWPAQDLLAPRSCLHLNAEDGPMPAHAGPQGLQLLVLQFPRHPSH